MLRDLFFSIWFDDFGDGWFVLVSLLFLITLAMLIFIIFRTKLKKEKFKTGHKIFFIIAALIMYQMVPVSLHQLSISCAYKKSYEQRSIFLEKAAIKTSMIPWQKGGYYCQLAMLYMYNKECKKIKPSLDKAYKYVKSYKYPCWGTHWITFDIFGNYDAAIETALNYKIGRKLSPAYGFAAECYIKKGDLNNALKYIDKNIMSHGESAYKLAFKAYILKQSGDAQEAKKLYAKALDRCKDDKFETSQETVKNIYTDFIEYDKKRIENSKLNRCLKE